ncbi:MAG TPA: hypothetical protein VFV05_09565 [Methylomirabilota bacterium]|nr:hypothetical protein [Methylomirabilota bacterium]
MTAADCEAILAREGMPPELRPVASEMGIASITNGGFPRRYSRAGQVTAALHLRWAVWGAHFASARDYLHSTNWTRYPAWHHDAWTRYCLDGLPPEQIARDMRKPFHRVRWALRCHRARAERRAVVVRALHG